MHKDRAVFESIEIISQVVDLSSDIPRGLSAYRESYCHVVLTVNFVSRELLGFIAVHWGRRWWRWRSAGICTSTTKSEGFSIFGSQKQGDQDRASSFPRQRSSAGPAARSMPLANTARYQPYLQRTASIRMCDSPTCQHGKPAHTTCSSGRIFETLPTQSIQHHVFLASLELLHNEVDPIGV